MAEETTMIASAQGAESGVQRRTGRVMLAVLCGDITGRVFCVSGRESVIGRGDMADVVIPGGDISRKHAKVILDVDGIAKVVDLKSTNGTFVNGRRIEVEVLREGDRVQVGKSTLVDVRYEYFQSPAAMAAASKAGAANTSTANLARAMDNINGPGTNTKAENQMVVTAYEYILSVRQNRLGETHPSVAAVFDAIGSVFAKQGMWDDALDNFLQALSIYEDLGEVDGVPDFAHTLMHVGECKLEKAAYRQAIVPLERALGMLEARNAGAVEVARVQFGLARGRFQLGEDHRQAVALAREARQGFAEGDQYARARVVDVDMWLANEAGVPASGNDEPQRRATRL